MRKYHLYCLDELGKIRKDEWFDAENDEDAIAKATAMKKPHACEIWDRDRFIGHVPPTSLSDPI